MKNPLWAVAAALGLLVATAPAASQERDPRKAILQEQVREFRQAATIRRAALFDIGEFCASPALSQEDRNECFFLDAGLLATAMRLQELAEQIELVWCSFEQDFCNDVPPPDAILEYAREAGTYVDMARERLEWSVRNHCQ